MRKQKNTKSSKAMQEIENETPFWEFLDIEFVESEKEFLFVTHYKQVPSFPELFKNLVGSPKLKQIEDSLFGNSGYKIHNQDWKERSNLSTELGARNVVYTLLDDKNKLIYIGETSQDLIKRLEFEPGTLSIFQGNIFFNIDSINSSSMCSTFELEYQLNSFLLKLK